jgi:hypothetical protein
MTHSLIHPALVLAIQAECIAHGTGRLRVHRPRRIRARRLRRSLRRLVPSAGSVH